MSSEEFPKGESESTQSEFAMRQPCREYLDVLMYCFSPANQVSTYYRSGTIDDCSKQTAQVKLCLKLKMPRSDEERIQMYEELKRKNDHAPSATVWPMRENPGKEWKTSTYSTGT